MKQKQKNNVKEEDAEDVMLDRQLLMSQQSRMGEEKTFQYRLSCIKMRCPYHALKLCVFFYCETATFNFQFSF